MNIDEFLKLARKRRSIRKFKPDPIPDEYIDEIIETARWAPSGANSQPWEFIVIKRQELRDRIIELIKEYSNLTHKMEMAREPELRFRWTPAGYVRAPVFIILCGDTRTKEVYPLNSVLQRGNSIFTSSLASAFLYMNLAATCLGLGAQWVSAIAGPYVQSLTKDLLGVPKELELYDMMAVGYPDTEPKPRLLRAREDIVHYEKYDMSKYRSQEEIQQFIRELRARSKPAYPLR